jgi:hypothetical protein
MIVLDNDHMENAARGAKPSGVKPSGAKPSGVKPFIGGNDNAR